VDTKKDSGENLASRKPSFISCYCLHILAFTIQFFIDLGIITL